MDLKLSITTLISIAYFLTLFIFKLFKSPDILSNLIESGTHAFIIFIILYTLATYVLMCLERLKKKEASDAIAEIRRLEEEQLARKNAAIKNKFSEIDRAVLEKERLRQEKEDEDEDDEYEDDEYEDENVDEDDIENTSETEYQSTSEKDIVKLKKEAGTQFDSNFIAEDIQI